MTRLKRTVRWVASHKLRTFLVILLLFVLYQLATIPWFSVPRLKDENPGQTALMRQRIQEAEDKGKKLLIRQSWVPLSKLPRHLTNAIVVAEDGTFFEHDGFDWFEVRQSLEKNIKERRAARGGSTITQQLAKNLYLSTSKDPLRKAREVVITWLLEQNLPKQRILELYVNVIEWGNGVFGVDAAARRYFGKPASALTLEESLRMAAVIPSPLRHQPNVDSRYVLRRSEIVRKRMQSRRFIPFPAEDDAEEQPAGEDAAGTTPEGVRDGTGPGEGTGPGDVRPDADGGGDGVPTPEGETREPTHGDPDGGNRHAVHGERDTTEAGGGR